MSESKSGEKSRKRLRKSDEFNTNPTKPKKQPQEKNPKIDIDGKLQCTKSDDEQLFGWSSFRIIRIPET